MNVDKELALEAKQLPNGDEVVFITRKSVGYDEFTTILPIVNAEVFATELEKHIKTDLSLKRLLQNPIDSLLGDGCWFVLTAEKSKKGNYYRSARLESSVIDSSARSKFWINFVSLRPLVFGLRKLIFKKA